MSRGAFHVAENKLRREQDAAFKQIAEKENEFLPRIQVPTDLTQIHALADRHQQALAKQKADANGMISIRRTNLFRIDVTESVREKLMAALHALITGLEQREYTFKPSQESYGSLRVRKGTDSLTLHCTELIQEIEREPTDEEKRKPSWEWQLKSRQPTGRLSFEIIASPPLRGKRTWSETEKLPLEQVLKVVCEKVDETFQRYEHFRQMEVVRAQQQAEQQRRWEEEQQQRREEQKRQAHHDRLQKVAQDRRDVLIEASLQWSVSQQAETFVNECEQRWKSKGDGKLSPEQAGWIAWARDAIKNISPFREAYPNPVSDGPFDESKVAFGGPYPKVRKLRGQMVEPEPSQSAHYSSPPAQPPEPFPYWLLHRRR